MTSVREAGNALLMVCDGARAKDDSGYNGGDAGFARDVLSRDKWTRKQQEAMYRTLRKYRGQLMDRFGIDYDNLTFEDVIPDYAERVAIAQAKREERRLQEQGLTLDYKDGKFILRGTTYQTSDIAKLVPFHKWNRDEMVWEYDAKKDVVIDAIRDTLLGVEHRVRVTPTSSATQYIKSHYDASRRFTEQVELAGAIKNGHTPDIDVPLKTKPFDHQKKAFLVSTALDSSALLMEQGTGKTLSAIATVGHRFQHNGVRKLLVMAPLSVVYVWVNEFKKHADFPYTIQVVEGNTEQKKKIFQQKPNPDKVNVLVINYDAVISRTTKEKDSKGEVIKDCNNCKTEMMCVRDTNAKKPEYRCPKCGSHLGSPRVQEKGGVAQEIFNWSPDMVILDESQRVKNRDAKRSEVVHKLGDVVEEHGGFKMILTGTPVTQNPLDLYSQYRFLDKRVFGDNYYRFRNKYAIMGGWEGKQVVGYRNLPDLIEKAHSIAYRVTKAEALDLPEFTDQILYVNLKESRPYYESMRQFMKVELTDVGKVKAPIILTQLLRLSQITGGFLPLELKRKDAKLFGELQEDVDAETWKVEKVGDEKMSVLKDFIEDLPKYDDPEQTRVKKVVIFCRFIPEIDYIVDMLRKMGISAESLKGDTKNRDDLIRRFQEEDDPRVLVIQIATGGLGITLHRANIVVFFSLNFSFADYEQARARVHRIGQHHPVTYVHLIAQRTIDEQVLEALQTKKNIADVVVDRIKKEGVEWI